MKRSGFGLLAALVMVAGCGEGMDDGVVGEGAIGDPTPGDTVGAIPEDAAAVSSPLVGAPIARRTRLGFLLVRWGAADAVTVATARAALFTNSTSVRNHYRESSYGIHDVSGDAFGPFVIPAPTSCDQNAIRLSAEAAARTAGVDLASFTNIGIYFPRTALCTFSGLGEQGTPTSPRRYTWFNGSLSPVSHELAHNFGLFHARSWNCGSASIAPPAQCVGSEFGDRFDPMGSGPARHFNAYEKQVESWFGGCNVVTLPVSRTVDIFPLEIASNGVQSVRVPMSGALCPSGLASCQYVIEYRRPVGFDGTGVGVSGVLVHAASAAATASTFLLDMRPDTPGNFTDAALAAGATFRDPTGLSITVTAAIADRATVRVTIPGGTGIARCLSGAAF